MTESTDGNNEDDIMKEIEAAGLKTDSDGKPVYKVPNRIPVKFSASRAPGFIVIPSKGPDLAASKIEIEIISLQKGETEINLFSSSKVQVGSVVVLQSGGAIAPVMVIACSRLQSGRILSTSGQTDRYQLVVKMVQSGK